MGYEVHFKGMSNEVMDKYNKKNKGIYSFSSNGEYRLSLKVYTLLKPEVPEGCLGRVPDVKNTVFNIKLYLAGLENEYCVITYDTEANRFDLNAEAHGKQEYTICIMKKMTMLRGYDPIDEMDEELSNELRLNVPVSTAFSQENSISSPEWQYNQILI